MTIYLSVIIIWILDYLLKYYKITQLSDTFCFTICTKLAIASQLILTGCIKQLPNGVLRHVFRVGICLNWIGQEFVFVLYFSSKLYILITEAFGVPLGRTQLAGLPKTTVAGSMTIARPSLNRGNRYGDRCYLHLLLTNKRYINIYTYINI